MTAELERAAFQVNGKAEKANHRGGSRNFEMEGGAENWKGGRKKASVAQKTLQCCKSRGGSLGPFTKSALHCPSGGGPRSEPLKTFTHGL